MMIKICGITSEEDALLAVAMGADMLGFVFAPSPRQVAPGLAGDIVKRLPPEIISVGVFRDTAPARVLDVAHLAGLRAVQLHGHENAEDTKWLSTRLGMVIKAFQAGDGRVRQAGDYGAHVIMLDAPSPGSGKVFDWAFASEIPSGNRVMIAGGLTAENVRAAIDRTRPWGVDVSTGVEQSPGKKDPIKVREFIKAVREAATGVERSGDEPEADSRHLYDWQEEA